MMNNNAKSNRRWHIRALALVPALAVAFGLTQIPAVASALTATSSVKLADEVNTVSAEEVNTASAETEVRPQFPGGEGALMQWLSMNMKYPEAMIKADLQGREVVSFTVMPDGKVADAKIIKSVCPEADEEVLRLVAEMPDWVPETVDGKPVAVSYALPVTFKLSGSNGKEENPVRIISVGADASEGAAESSVKVKSASEPDDHTIRVVGYGTKVASEGRTTETLQSDGSDGQGSPAIFVDGVRHNGDLSSIDSADIQSVSAIKDSPDYPNGRIDITLKKK